MVQVDVADRKGVTVCDEDIELLQTPVGLYDHESETDHVVVNSVDAESPVEVIEFDSDEL